MGTTGAPTAYGVPLVIEQGNNNTANTGNLRSVVTAYSDAAANIYGFLVRSFPTNSGQDPLGTSTPPGSGIVDVCRMGYISVLLSGSNAAVKGGQVAIWTAAATGTHIVGGIEYNSGISSNGFQLTGALFQGPADANGYTEISFNLM